MSTELITAILAAVVSIGALIWNLSTIKLSRTLVLSAEESAKRSELVRIHALKAVDSTLASIAPMIASFGSLIFLKNHGYSMDITQPEIQKQVKIIGEEKSKLFTLSITAAPYLTNELLEILNDIVAKTSMINFDDLIDIECELKEFVLQLSKHARSKYLE